MHSRYLHCAACRAERRFEIPPCPDGHGADCAELVCTVCGSAILAGAPFALVSGRHPAGRPTPRRRRAA
ncbi:MAG TPA: hypothetical protein VHN18_08600 [Micromonosporaceae bacterium]|nr:hypothetical protein [Micromonosporaceae bacterium]